jgi:hypothetical protein
MVVTVNVPGYTGANAVVVAAVAVGASAVDPAGCRAQSCGLRTNKYVLYVGTLW